jgi:hypothetical protein
MKSKHVQIKPTLPHSLNRDIPKVLTKPNVQRINTNMVSYKVPPANIEAMRSLT